jgi:hypothetical protein
VIICAINSELSPEAPSENTLRLGSKAMKVRNQLKVNEKITDQARIEQLLEENRILKERLASPQSTRDSDSFHIQVRRLENENDDLVRAVIFEHPHRHQGSIHPR